MVEHPKLDNSADFFKRQLNTNQRFVNVRAEVSRHAGVDGDLGDVMLVTNGYTYRVEVTTADVNVTIQPDLYSYDDEDDWGNTYYSCPCTNDQNSKPVSRFENMPEHNVMFTLIDNLLFGV